MTSSQQPSKPGVATVVGRDRHQEWAGLRSADVVLDPTEMGIARYNRHSFARSFLRTAATQRWAVTREHWQLDALGRGEIVYRVDADGYVFRFVAFSTVLEESQRTDRVIAESWDVTAALIEGQLTATRWATLREEVPQQEAGRADPQTFVWCRANRSARYFDYVARRLGAGRQPEPHETGDTAYILRSTAFYGNGKFGLTDFDGIPVGHPLRVPYRSQMLAAWLLRELAYDLVEHCAQAMSPDAVRLTGAWQRALGLGNATGLGLVPYLVNHPQVLNAWCAMRELPLAHVLLVDEPASADLARVAALLRRAVGYFAERANLPTAPFAGCTEVAQQVAQVVDVVEDYARTRTGGASAPVAGWRSIRDAAQVIGPEARGVLDAVLVETTSDLDEEMEALLRCDETLLPEPGLSVRELVDLLDEQYGWVRRYDFQQPSEHHYFWFTSENNEEPRRGRRGLDPGEAVEHPVAVARDVAAMWADLTRTPDDTTVAAFLLAHPGHRGVTARVQTLRHLPFGEVRTNLIGQDFVPLNLQRFQLAIYGMESYSPQSTDWLRVALFCGAPRATDVAAGVDDDWMFTHKPTKDET